MVKRKKNSVILASIFLFIFVFSFVLISAVPVLVAPATDGTLTGATAVLNVTNGTLIEMLNCTWYASSSLTANSTAVSIGAQTNESVSADHINMTFDSTILEDANNYVVYAQCFNSTSNETTVSSTGVIIANTEPTAPTLSPADFTTRTTSGTQTFTGTVVDAETTSCTYTIYRDGSSSDGDSGSATYATTSCTFDKTFSTSADNGVWWFTVTASDETDTTSSTNKYNVNLVGSGGGLVTPLTVSDGFFQEGNGRWIVGIIIIFGIVALTWAFSRKFKK